jgi:hypothetical protein
MLKYFHMRVQGRYGERSVPTQTRVGAGMKYPHQNQALACRPVLFKETNTA